MHALEKPGVTDILIHTDKDTALGDDFLQDFPQLKSIDLSSLSLTHLRKDVFGAMKNVERLVVRNFHRLSKLEDGVFANMPALQDLRVRYNDNLKSIGPTAFQNLTSLISLNLNDNSISYIAPNTFKGSHNLRTLTLTHNKLTSVAWDTLLDVRKVAEIQFECYSDVAQPNRSHLSDFAKLAPTALHIQGEFENWELGSNKSSLAGTI